MHNCAVSPAACIIVQWPQEQLTTIEKAYQFMLVVKNPSLPSITVIYFLSAAAAANGLKEKNELFLVMSQPLKTLQ